MPRRAPSPDLNQAIADALDRTGSPDRTAALHAGDGGQTSPELDATTELLAIHGLKQWTVDDVARLSNVGRATLYRRHGSRDALIQAAVTREARRFFQAVARRSARNAHTLTDLVVDGFLEGLRLAQDSPLGELLTRDPATAMALVANTRLLDAATSALADLYRAMTNAPNTDEAAVRAEALVRLALSFLLIPSVDPDEKSRERLRSMVAALIEGG